MDIWGNMRFYFVSLFLFAALTVGVLAQTNDVEALNALTEVSLWLVKVRLWIFGGICALVLSVCFFLRS